MIIMVDIPEWQYPLYKEPDKVAYIILERLGKSKSHPKLVGSKEELNDFLKLLVISQKMKDYRKFRNIALNEFKKKEVSISKVLGESKNLEISKGIDKSWAIFTQDKRLCELMDDFQDARILFIGNDNEVSQFFIRFQLSQLLQDWRGPLMAVLLECLQDKNVKIAKLNNLLKLWDYTKVF